MNVRAHVWVTGRVQGVSFRAYTQREARRKGARGWVRNLEDGRVEAVFEGPREIVDGLVAWCHQGPPDAEVDDVKIAWEQASGEEDFVIRH
jgi:acylphosphatase